MVININTAPTTQPLSVHEVMDSLRIKSGRIATDWCWLRVKSAEVRAPPFWGLPMDHWHTVVDVGLRGYLVTAATPPRC